MDLTTQRAQREAYQAKKYFEPACEMSQYHSTSIENLEKCAHVMLLSWGGGAQNESSLSKFTSERYAGRVHARCDDCGYPKGAHETLPSRTPTKLLSTIHKSTLRPLLEILSAAATAAEHRTRTHEVDPKRHAIIQRRISRKSQNIYSQ
jgi:hypothetical protein